MKSFSFILLSALLLCACKEEAPVKKPGPVTTTSTKRISVIGSANRLIPTTMLREVKQFLRRHPGYNQHTAFLIDMNRPSGLYRFYVVNLRNDSITHTGLVAQGSNTTQTEQGMLRFSNEINSNCTSLGKYKISFAYNGNFGKAYKLIGLDTTNSNAFARAVVLHKYSAVPDEEQDYPIVPSLGCPMVSHHFFGQLESIIDNSSKPILMEIWY